MCSRNPVHQDSVSEMGWEGRTGCLLLAGGSPAVGWEAGSEIHTAGADQEATAGGDHTAPPLQGLPQNCSVFMQLVGWQAGDLGWQAGDPGSQ